MQKRQSRHSTYATPSLHIFPLNILKNEVSTSVQYGTFTWFRHDITNHKVLSNNIEISYCLPTSNTIYEKTNIPLVGQNRTGQAYFQDECICQDIVASSLSLDLSVEATTVQHRVLLVRPIQEQSTNYKILSTKAEISQNWALDGQLYQF